MENNKRGTDTNKQEDNWFISISTIKFKNKRNTGIRWIADWFLRHFFRLIKIRKKLFFDVAVIVSLNRMLHSNHIQLIDQRYPLAKQNNC